MNMDERWFYGETILNVLSRVVSKYDGVYTTLCETKKDIKRRLIFMMNVKKLPKSLIAISLALSVMLGVGGIATAFAAQAAAGTGGNKDQTTAVTAPNTSPQALAQKMDKEHQKQWDKKFKELQLKGLVDNINIPPVQETTK